MKKQFGADFSVSQTTGDERANPLSANPIKWSNTLKQLVD